MLVRATQRNIAYATGVLFIVMVLAIAFAAPNPTSFQYTVFRVVLALAAAGFAAMVPGFIAVTVGSAIRAGGAIAVFAIVYFFAPALPTSAEAVKSPGEGSTQGPPESTDAYPIKINRLEDAPDVAQNLAALLRQYGYSVNVIRDSEIGERPVTKENYSVISVGKDVPVPVAAKAIRLTHNAMPWVKFIFLQYQQPSMDKHLLLNAHDDWVDHLSLHPLSEVDFEALRNESLSPEDFHRLIQTFRD